MNLTIKRTALVIAVCLFANFCNGQLLITSESTAQALAQRLVGDGVTISNATLTADPRATGFFKNLGNTAINIDSGIVLTNGRAKSTGILDEDGVDGDGFNSASSVTASLQHYPITQLSGDADLATLIGETTDNLHDACILEFDFVPLGDSIKFRYVFSSEEYTPSFVCTFNDAFAFLISGPGFTGLQNIALIPNTTTPVSIFNVNDVPGGGCPNNMGYYVDNENNTSFNHDGHTTVLSALAEVQPCQTYHLKLVIADVGDGVWDSGVFLEAKSLTSNAFQLTNLTQLDPTTGNSYLVEGCAVGALKIRRQNATLFSQTIALGYGGTAVNGVDVQTLPASITIPANETEVLLNIFPIIDNMPEGIENLKIYTLAPCGVATPTDSATIQIRDYDTLGISPDTIIICRSSSTQLIATSGYSVYQWDANPALSNINITNPIATPTSDSTMFYCTSTEGTCHARDSAFVYWKRVKLISRVDVNCHDSSTGQIVVGAGPGWESPLSYAIGSGAYQPGNTFNNLPIGTYTVKLKDATGCVDSMDVTIIQAFPDLLITNTTSTNGSCTGGNDGTITVSATGGNPSLVYSTNGTTYQPGNIFTIAPGTYTVTVKDVNGCKNSVTGVIVGFDNTITLSTDPDPTICEGKNSTITAVTNGTNVLWTPAATLDNATSFTPVATPTVTTKYYVKSTLGICDKLDSVTVFVNPAPVANAGADFGICFGGSTQLSGSGGVSYSWTPSRYLSNPGISNPLVTQPATITYLLSVTDINGCESLSKDDITITVAPPAKLFAGYDTAIAINQPLQLNAVDINNIGFIQYTWSPAGGLNNPFITNPVAILSDAVTYLVVTASTINNCVGIDSIKVNTYKGPEIYVANSFTPNGDGKNDVLRAFPVGIKTFGYFRIYNRFGELVFATTNANTGWTGKYKGAMQNLSTFVWIAEGVSYQGKLIQRKGTTTIIQ